MASRKRSFFKALKYPGVFGEMASRRNLMKRKWSEKKVALLSFVSAVTVCLGGGWICKCL